MLEATDSPMTTLENPPRPKPSRAVLATLLAGGGGVLALGLVAAATSAPTGPSAAAAGLMAAATAALVFWQLNGPTPRAVEANSFSPPNDALDPPMP